MYELNPFGNPDGARADLKEIEYSFITEFPFGVQITKCEDELLNKRVIVGAKGSGKTVYLRKIQSMLKDKQANKTGIYVDDQIDQNMNCTEKVIAFCDFYSMDTLSEKWTQLWKTAIYIAISHKFLFDNKLNSYMDNGDKEVVRKKLKSVNLLFESSFSVYQIVSSLLTMEDTVNKMDRLLYNTCWYELNNLLRKCMRTSPTIYMFFDAVDLEYEHAPLHWSYCQKGLFNAIMIFLQDNTFGEKLHLIMSMRDNVFTSLLKSEHATKTNKESHIFTLDWDEKT